MFLIDFFQVSFFFLIILIEKFFTIMVVFHEIKHKMIENTDYNWVSFNDSINRI